MAEPRVVAEVLSPIDSAFATCDESCPACHGVRWVCAEHPNRPWHGFIGEPGDEGTCDCGAEGMPCPTEQGLHA